MKIAFDVDVLAKQMDINRMVHQVADWGYKYIEQSPHPRINPFYKHPLFSKECEQEYRQALRETGVEISSFIVVFDFETISFIAGISLFKQFTNLLDKFILKTSVDFKFCINLVTIKSNIKVTINIAIFFIEPFAFIIVTLNI